MQNDDAKWMSRALSLAERGAGGASPNPLVGCLIVRGERIVGEGYHARFGGPHAEINALRAAGRRARGATLYVTLEPCSHWGKTPPCTEAILRSGVHRVVAAMQDPNPLVNGRGLQILKRAGIRVQSGICQAEAKETNRAFLKWIRRGRPYVTVKAAASLDGRIATSGGESKWITSAEARRLSHRLRSESDAVLVGAETIRRDDPSLTSHGALRNPVRIVLAGKSALPKRAKIFDGSAPTWILHCPPLPKSAASGGAEWLEVPGRNGRVSFAKALPILARRGISKLLVEGGGETLASVLEAKAADEICLFLAPLLIGGERAKSFFEGEGFARLKSALRLKEWTIKKVGPDLLIRARIAG